MSGEGSTVSGGGSEPIAGCERWEPEVKSGGSESTCGGEGSI